MRHAIGPTAMFIATSLIGCCATGTRDQPGVDVRRLAPVRLAAADGSTILTSGADGDYVWDYALTGPGRADFDFRYEWWLNGYFVGSGPCGHIGGNLPKALRIALNRTATGIEAVMLTEGGGLTGRIEDLWNSGLSERPRVAGASCRA